MIRLLVVGAAGLVYFWIAFVVLQVLDVLTLTLGWPPWVSIVGYLVLLVGLVGVLIYAWHKAGRFVHTRLAQGRAREDLDREVQTLREQVTSLQSEVDSMRQEQQSGSESQ